MRIARSKGSTSYVHLYLKREAEPASRLSYFKNILEDVQSQRKKKERERERLCESYSIVKTLSF